MNQFGTTANTRIENQRIFLNALELPALLFQSEPRQVITANAKACELFGKDLSQIEGHRGGQVFDCVHSFSDEGCGKDVNCEDCTVKNAVVETFATGNSHYVVQTVLDVKKNDTTGPFDLQVSTERTNGFVIMTIDTYEAQI